MRSIKIPVAWLVSLGLAWGWEEQVSGPGLRHEYPTPAGKKRGNNMFFVDVHLGPRWVASQHASNRTFSLASFRAMRLRRISS